MKHTEDVMKAVHLSLIMALASPALAQEQPADPNPCEQNAACKAAYKDYVEEIGQRRSHGYDYEGIVRRYNEVSGRVRVTASNASWTALMDETSWYDAYQFRERQMDAQKAWEGVVFQYRKQRISLDLSIHEAQAAQQELQALQGGAKLKHEAGRKIRLGDGMFGGQSKESLSTLDYIYVFLGDNADPRLLEAVGKKAQAAQVAEAQKRDAHWRAEMAQKIDVANAAVKDGIAKLGVMHDALASGKFLSSPEAPTAGLSPDLRRVLAEARAAVAAEQAAKTLKTQEVPAPASPLEIGRKLEGHRKILEGMLPGDCGKLRAVVEQGKRLNPKSAAHGFYKRFDERLASAACAPSASLSRLPPDAGALKLIGQEAGDTLVAVEDRMGAPRATLRINSRGDILWVKWGQGGAAGGGYHGVTALSGHAAFDGKLSQVYAISLTKEGKLITLGGDAKTLVSGTFDLLSGALLGWKSSSLAPISAH